MIKRKYYFFDSIKTFFALNKSVCIATSLVILTFVLTGLFYIFKLDYQLTIDLLPCFLFKCYFVKSSSFFFYFFFKSLLFCCLFFALYFCSYLKFGNLIFWPIILYISFLLGKFVGILIYLFNGCFLFALLYLVIEFVLIFIFSLFLLRFLSFNKQLSIYGNCYIRGKELKIILFAFIIFILLILFQTINVFIIGKIFI